VFESFSPNGACAIAFSAKTYLDGQTSMFRGFDSRCLLTAAFGTAMTVPEGVSLPQT